MEQQVITQGTNGKKFNKHGMRKVFAAVSSALITIVLTACGGGGGGTGGVAENPPAQSSTITTNVNIDKSYPSQSINSASIIGGGVQLKISENGNKIELNNPEGNSDNSLMLADSSGNIIGLLRTKSNEAVFNAENTAVAYIRTIIGVLPPEVDAEKINTQIKAVEGFSELVTAIDKATKSGVPPFEQIDVQDSALKVYQNFVKKQSASMTSRGLMAGLSTTVFPINPPHEILTDMLTASPSSAANGIDVNNKFMVSFKVKSLNIAGNTIEDDKYIDTAEVKSRSILFDAFAALINFNISVNGLYTPQTTSFRGSDDGYTILKLSYDSKSQILDYIRLSETLFAGAMDTLSVGKQINTDKIHLSKKTNSQKWLSCATTVVEDIISTLPSDLYTKLTSFNGMSVWLSYLKDNNGSKLLYIGKTIYGCAAEVNDFDEIFKIHGDILISTIDMHTSSWHASERKKTEILNDYAYDVGTSIASLIPVAKLFFSALNVQADVWSGLSLSKQISIFSGMQPSNLLICRSNNQLITCPAIVKTVAVDRPNESSLRWVVSGQNLPSNLTLNINSAATCDGVVQKTVLPADFGTKITFTCASTSNVKNASFSLASSTLQIDSRAVSSWTYSDPDQPVAQTAVISYLQSNDTTPSTSINKNANTTDTTPLVSGTLNMPISQAYVVRIYDSSTLLGRATVNGTSWSFQSPVLGIGSHVLQAVVVRGDGVEGVKSASWNFQVIATVTIPTISTQPSPQIITAGQAATFTVTATGSAPISYQWKKNGTNIANATSSRYTTPATSSADNGAVYTVSVSNSAGTVTSNGARLTVSAAIVAPSITTQPSAQSITAGQTATFSVAATGSTPLSYQWKKNGSNIASATSSSYTTPATSIADNGAVYTVSVSNSAGTVTSNSATLTVGAAASVLTVTAAAISVTHAATGYQDINIGGSGFTGNSWHQFSSDGGSTWFNAVSAPVFNSATSLTVAVNQTLAVGTVLRIRVCSSSSGNASCSSGYVTVTIGSGAASGPTVTAAAISVTHADSGSQDISISGSGFTGTSWHQFSSDAGSTWTVASNAPVFNSATSLTVAVSKTLAEGTVFRIRVCSSSSGNASCSSGYVTVTIGGDVVASIPIPHSGVTASQCYQAGSNTLVSCSSSGAQALNSQQDGHRTSINAMSYSLVPNASGGTYAKTECVKDDVTGLIWEGKTTSSTRAGSSTYTNYDSTASAQKSGGTNPTQAEIDASTNSMGYVNAVNSLALCGFTDWRMPTVDELQGIVDYGTTNPSINSSWFPNTQSARYWSSSPNVGYSNYAWYVSFLNGSVDGSYYGSSGYYFRYLLHAVRLVRASQ